MELEEKIVIRKILVKAPAKKEEAFRIFPFLIALSEEYAKAEINVICEEKCSLAYNFLPFKVRSFERPKEKLTLIETHHYCANLDDVFNVDIFFDLENTFNSAFMGFNFRAKERVGYEVGWNKYFLTKKFLLEQNSSIEKSSLRLLELYTGKKFQDLKISRVRTEGKQVDKVEQLFKEPEPPKFIMIMLDNFKNITQQIEVWKKFFDSFQNQKFIIWSQEDEDLISEIFSRIDLGHNDLYIHRGSDTKELIYLLNKVQGVVVNDLWAEALCNYFGVNAVSFIINNQINLPRYQYFVFKPQRFIFQTNCPIKFSYLEEDREYFEMNQVVDHLHFYFKL